MCDITVRYICLSCIIYIYRVLFYLGSTPFLYVHGIIQFEVETGLAFDKVAVQMTSYVGNVNSHTLHLYNIFTRHEYTDLTRHKIIIAQILTI